MHSAIQKYEHSSAPQPEVLAVFKAFQAALEAQVISAAVAPDVVQTWINQAVNERFTKAVEDALQPLDKAINGAVGAAVQAATKSLDDRLKEIEQWLPDQETASPRAVNGL